MEYPKVRVQGETIQHSSQKKKGAVKRQKEFEQKIKLFENTLINATNQSALCAELKTYQLEYIRQSAVKCCECREITQ